MARMQIVLIELAQNVTHFALAALDRNQLNATIAIQDILNTLSKTPVLQSVLPNTIQILF